MKMTTLKSVAIALGLASSAFGQATSPVVGYETFDLNVGFNPIGLRFLESPAVSGTLGVVGATSVQDVNVNFTEVLDADTTYILEIEDEVGAIQIFDEFAGNEITTQDDLSAMVVAGTPYTIRPISTIETVFGANNSAGLTEGANTTGSDTIFVPDGNGGFLQYFFFNGGILVQNDNGTLVQATPSEVELPHDRGIFIVSPSPNSFVISGDLKVTNTSFPVTIGFNPFASAFPVDGATIASVFGPDNSAGLAAGANTTAADTIFVPDGVGGFSQFFFFNGNILVQDDNGTLAQATAENVSLDNGYIVNSPSGGSFFTEAAPPVILNLNE